MPYETVQSPSRANCFFQGHGPGCPTAMDFFTGHGLTPCDARRARRRGLALYLSATEGATLDAHALSSDGRRNMGGWFKAVDKPSIVVPRTRRPKPHPGYSFRVDADMVAANAWRWE